MTKNKLRKLRASLGMTQKEFARWVGISVRTVEAWESGSRNMSKFYLAHIEAVLKRCGLD